MGIISVLFSEDKLVKQIKADAAEFSGADGTAALDHWLAVVHADPAITQAEAKAEWIAWATAPANNNLVYFDSAVDSLIRNFCPAPNDSWAGLTALFLSRSLQRWADAVVPCHTDSASTVQNRDQYGNIVYEMTHGTIDGLPVIVERHNSWELIDNAFIPTFGEWLVLNGG